MFDCKPIDPLTQLMPCIEMANDERWSCILDKI